MFSRRLKVLTVGLAASLLLAACGTSSDTSDAPKKSETIRLALDNDSANLPAWVAMDEGFFKKRGLDVKFTTVQSIGTLPTTLGKSFDIVEAPITALISAADQGIDIKALAADGGVETPDKQTSSLMVLKSSGITSVKQLEGKVLGAITIAGTIHLATASWLDREGVDMSKIKVREVSLPTQFDQLKAGRIDAVETVTSFRAQMLGSGLVRDLGNPKLELTKGAKQVKSLAWASNSKWASEHKDEIVKFREALDEAIAFIDTNTDAAREILQKYSGLPAEVAKNMHLPQFSSSIAVEDLDMWLSAMTRVGDFKGTIDTKSLIFNE